MKIAVLGLGAYGIALAKTLYQNDNQVAMWTKYQDEADNVILKRENQSLLPGVKIPKKITITTNLEECLSQAEIIIIAVPMSAVREVAKEMANYLEEKQVICIVSKGIENSTHALMSEVVFEETKSTHICMLSGPSFAKDLVQDTEVGLMIASESDTAIMALKVCLENEKIALNATKDMVGVEVAAAVKNVFAIFMGIMEGLQKNDSTKAAVLTCLVNDLRLMIEVLGGKPQTIFSYAGLGDMLLTCMSSKSRNFTFGKYIGQGNTIEQSLEQMCVKTVEGLYTLNSIVELLKEKQITIKSINLLYNILYGKEKVTDILREIKN